MTRTTLHAVLVAAMVLMAGCAGGLSGTPTNADGSTGGDGGDGAMSGDTGTVDLYISDQPAAIEDFEHLNVTITSVGFQRAGSDDGNETTESMNETDELETDTPENASEESPVETEADDSVEDAEDADEDDEADENGESGEWIEHDVDGRVADLTELRGDNATLLGQFTVPNGTYTTVFVHVSEVNATLKTGESVNVKLPSEKLQIHEQFEVENGSQIDFVFDIAVHKAGNSGKYILRPVISESGTDVPINRVDTPDDGRDAADRDDADEAMALNASFEDPVAPGSNATIIVTRNGAPVENASVIVNDEPVGQTDAEGRISFLVPDGEELGVEIRHGEAEVELERTFAQAQGGTPTPAYAG
ncbi:MAG: DUF4382 domain-containing protein [Salinirussus sp.]